MAKSKHSIISEDAHSFLVHDGEKHFAVAKRGVAEEMHDRIRGLPKYADGGLVEEEPGFLDSVNNFVNRANSSSNDAASGTSGVFGKIGDAIGSAGQAVADASLKKPEIRDPAAAPLAQEEAMDRRPESVSPEAIVASAPVESPQAIVTQNQNAQRASSMAPVIAEAKAGAQMQAQGIEAQSQAEQGLAQEQAKFYEQQKLDEQQAAQKKRMDDLLVQQQRIESENTALYQAAMNNKIDPNRVYKNMSTGNRVLASIALILGGAGSGGNAANNAALNVMNKAIDRDIEAQMKEGDSARSLYQINLQKYRDVGAAMDATRLQMNSIAQGQLAGLTAKYGGQNAKARGEALMGQLKTQSATLTAGLLEKQSQITENYAQAQTKASAASGKNAENFVPGYGYAQIKPTDKDRDTISTVEEIKDGIKELQQRATKGPSVGWTTWGKQNAAKVSYLRNRMKDALQLGVLSDKEYDRMDMSIADPGAWNSGAAIEALQATSDALEGKKNSTLRKIGIAPARGGDGGAPKISFEEFQKRKKEGKL